MARTFDVLRIDHTSEVIARHIRAVQMHAYAQEAELLAAVDFPPLRRTVDDIRSSEEEFFGAYSDDHLVGSISVQSSPGSASKTICSLVVVPPFQRRGVAKQLMEAIQRLYRGHDLVVQTGAKNVPALNLYAQFGFAERERFSVGSEPLEIVVLCRSATVRRLASKNAA